MSPMTEDLDDVQGYLHPHNDLNFAASAFYDDFIWLSWAFLY